MMTHAAQWRCTTCGEELTLPPPAPWHAMERTLNALTDKLTRFYRSHTTCEGKR